MSTLTARLLVRTHEPCNAEAPPQLLALDHFTSQDRFFKRNHGPFVTLDSEEHKVILSLAQELAGRFPKALAEPLALSLAGLRSGYAEHHVEAVLQCAGNRRAEMNAAQPVEGVVWAKGTLGNAVWTGVLLRDVLLSVGFPALEPHTRTELIPHVIFEADQECEEEVDKSVGYGASIPLSLVMDSNFPIMLCYEMNGETLPIAHGGPLRIVAPGIIGARWVKWVSRIRISSSESASYYQQLDYRILPSVATPKTKRHYMALAPSMQEYGINSAICIPEANEIITKESGLTVRGYALSGHGNAVKHVQVALVQGQSAQTPASDIRARALAQNKWYDASLLPPPANSNHNKSHLYFGWSLWELKLSPADIVHVGRESLAIVAKCVDTAGIQQPCETEWNLRGLAESSWNVVHVQVI